MLIYFKCNMCACSESTYCNLNIYHIEMYSDFRQHVLILILIAITYILEFANMHL